MGTQSEHHQNSIGTKSEHHGNTVGTNLEQQVPFFEDSVAWSVSESDIVTNLPLVEAVAEVYGHKVPSGFFLADVLLRLDELLAGRLLIPRESRFETRQSMALCEGGKWKKLVQHLRQLWRDHPHGARTEEVARLKALLVKKEARRVSQRAPCFSFSCLPCCSIVVVFGGRANKRAGMQANP